MDELERWDPPGKELDWRVRQELVRINGTEVVAKRDVDARGGLAHHRARLGIKHAFDLAEQTFDGAVGLERRVDQSSQRDTALEFVGREIMVDAIKRASRFASAYEDEVMRRQR